MGSYFLSANHLGGWNIHLLFTTNYSEMKNEKVINFFTLAVAALTVIQGMLPSMNALISADSMTITSAVVMFLVSGLTTWKQALSDEVQNKAMIPTIVVAVIATFGGLNDLLGVFHFSELTGQWIRFTITVITAILNITSKIFWPTDQTKSLI